MIKKTLIVGDIHGNYQALKSLLTNASFDYENDQIIVLGDICDGNPYVDQCIDELLKIKHCTFILGNHDVWALQWMKFGIELPIWYHQGGCHTIASYNHDYVTVPQLHIDFLEGSVLYQKIKTKAGISICVHGGFNPEKSIETHDNEFLMWDRSLCQYAKNDIIPAYQHVYVGHTSTQFFTQDPHSNYPLHLNNLWMLDTGAGWYGPLSGIWHETQQIVQSHQQVSTTLDV